MITIAIILLLSALAWKIIHDYKFWLKEKSVKHKLEWWWMVLMCSPSIILFTISSDFYWQLALPISCAMCASFIWLFFDGIYNSLRGYAFFSVGSDDEDDAASDNFLQALPYWLNVSVKIIPMSILIYLYIKSL